jgi:hypothetical protein
MENVKIERIERARLTSERPRKMGCNSRLGEHGLHVHPPIAGLTTVSYIYLMKQIGDLQCQN